MLILIEYADEIQLDPSFEFSNAEGNHTESVEPYAIKENVEKMQILQALTKVGFVEPVGEKHMFFAAMNSKTCRINFVRNLLLASCEKRYILGCYGMVK